MPKSDWRRAKLAITVSRSPSCTTAAGKLSARVVARSVTRAVTSGFQRGPESEIESISIPG